MNSASPAPLTAASIGPAAVNALTQTGSGRGRVIAANSAAIYVSLEAGLLCLVREDGVPGPFVIITSLPRRSDLRCFGVAAGQTAFVSPSRIVSPGCLELDLRAAGRWLPDAWPAIVDPARIAIGLDRLRQCLPAHLGETGLGGFIRAEHMPEPDDLVGHAARKSILVARDDLSATPRRDPPGHCWVRPLIGLGHGLTPSGDDFVAGLLVAMHAVGFADQARRLWSAVCAGARAATNPISLAMLEAAADGMGCASLHSAIGAIMSGDCPAAAVARLSSCGHTSGWDALAGAAVVLESRTAERRAAA